MEIALSRLESQPGAEEAVFLLVRSMATRDRKYHLRLGAFFDPQDTRPKGAVTPNVMFAYDEYEAAGPTAEARQSRDRLVAWLERLAPGGDAGGVEGIDDLKRHLGR
jgi:hypothetical protein